MERQFILNTPTVPALFMHTSTGSVRILKICKRRNNIKGNLLPLTLFLKKSVSIKKTGVIAYGGNSGSSGGPHLHFEIRDSKTQDALNPLAYNFP
jgi:hypothetical protein